MKSQPTTTRDSDTTMRGYMFMGRRKEPTHLFYCRKILQHRMRLTASPTAANNCAIGRDFDKFVNWRRQDRPSDGHVLLRSSKPHRPFSLSFVACMWRHRPRRDTVSSRDTTFARGRGHGGTGHVIACNIGHRCWLIYLACAAPYRHAVGIRDPCCRHLIRPEMGIGHLQAQRTADSRPRMYKSLGEVDPI